MRPILVPSDFSGNSTTALRYAIRLAAIWKTSVLVIHCSPYPANPEYISGSPEEKKRILDREAESVMKKLQKQVGAAYHYLGRKLDPETRVSVFFNPMIVEQLIATAKAKSVGLIVLGSHGATGLKKLLFGSTASLLIAKSPLPVLAIPQQYRYRKIKSLAYASDLDNLKPELKKIIEFAEPLKAGIGIVHFEADPALWVSREKLAVRTLKTTGYHRLSFKMLPSNSERPVYRQLMDYVKQSDSQWLVMFTRVHSFREKIFQQSATGNLAAALPLPLLSFQK